MPDLNSVPPSPHVLASGTHSRRQSANLPAASSPPSTQSSVNILPSNQAAVNQQIPSQALPSPGFPPPQSPMGPPSDAAVGPGPGPLRHPRPLTASELHMQLEKEQEAVVNRLTRELSLLRAAHNASVVSNTSSTSNAASSHDPIVESSLLSGSGFSIPTARRHHRTSSSTSQTFPSFVSSYDARARPSHPASLSRQNSSASRRSQTGSPAPPSSIDPSNYFHQQRIPAAATNSVMMSSVVATPGSSVLGDQMSPGLMPATLRYEETAFYRQELDNAKKENEALKRRIRELERLVRERRSSDASRNRSDSASTTASASVAPGGGVSIAGPRESIYGHGRDRERAMQSSTSLAGGVSIGVPDEEVKVGESAASGRSGNDSQR
ncbi:uncharacterized protein TrAFT101_002885 [Trichoderma asperellum]|uniref:uncharacterized protein n=1 Tax=Trichoderma asperellum TaxID=101201 RepID=UPI0033270ABB|nr:hypothetical protein TrAFT101_002885 [Trichoderma asperellum]